MPNPTSLISGNKELPEVEQLGTITLEQLNQYHCNNPDRRCLCLLGKIYDVTSALNSYGPDGAYKEYAGHDISLTIGAHVTGNAWLDKFVKLNEEMMKGAKNWSEYYDSKYPVCGKLDKYDEDVESWPELTEEELTQIKKGCTIM